MDNEERISEDLYQTVLSLLTEYLASGDFVVTKERQNILKEVLSISRPFLATDLFKNLKGRNYHVSLTTIYNTLNLFCRAGITLRFALQEGTFFLASYHCQNRLIIVCNECGKITYLRRSKLYQQLNKTIVPHFSRVQHSMISYGYCRECRRRLFGKNSKQESLLK